MKQPKPLSIRPLFPQGAPTLEARVVASAAPIAFSRMRNERPRKGQSFSPPPEEAFSFQLPLVSAPFSPLRYAGRSLSLPASKDPGRAYLLDLSARPTVGLDSAFDNVRIYIAQTTIDELAYEKGLRSVGGLVQPTFGDRDPVLFHLARALVPALERSHEVSPAFLDYIGLAIHEHVIRTYGAVAIPERRRGGRLAPWQVRRVEDLVEANLAGNPSVAELARACGLSTSHFNEAFKTTTGLPPHRWLLKQRTDRSKRLLGETDMDLATIAASCGFYDQSHFSRVFSRMEHLAPGAWRRRHRSA